MLRTALCPGREHISPFVRIPARPGSAANCHSADTDGSLGMSLAFWRDALRRVRFRPNRGGTRSVASVFGPYGFACATTASATHGHDGAWPSTGATTRDRGPSSVVPLEGRAPSRPSSIPPLIGLTHPRKAPPSLPGKAIARAHGTILPAPGSLERIATFPHNSRRCEAACPKRTFAKPDVPSAAASGGMPKTSSTEPSRPLAATQRSLARKTGARDPA